MSKVSFVIPCYRSSKTIGGVVNEIESTMAQLAYEYEIILVNDSSPDDTFAVISALAEADGHITAVDLAKNFGQHAALMCGIRHSSGDILVCLDDDGQTPADEVGKLLEKIEAGYDVVYASYDHKQHSGFRNFGSRVNAWMTEILRYENCFPYVMGLVLRSTKNICNVPVNHRSREQGQSGYTLGKLLSLWMNGFTSFSIKPLRIATYFGALTAVAGFIYALIIVIRHFAVGMAPLGWSSTTALLLILGGVILLVLGLIGEYIGRIFMCVNSSPQYVERSVVKRDEAP